MTTPPQGWYPMGTMFAHPTNLVMSEESDEQGIPLWVRPGPEPEDSYEPGNPFLCTICEEGCLDPNGETTFDESANATLLTCSQCGSQFDVGGKLIYYFGKAYEEEMLWHYFEQEQEDYYRENHWE